MAEAKKTHLAEIRVTVDRIQDESGGGVATNLYIDDPGNYVLDALELLITNVQRGLGDMPFGMLMGLVLHARKKREADGGESVRVDLSDAMTWRAQQRGDGVG